MQQANDLVGDVGLVAGDAHQRAQTQQLIIENDDLRGEKLSEFLLAAFKNLKASLREKRAFYIWYAGGAVSDFLGLGITGLLLVVGFIMARGAVSLY